MGLRFEHMECSTNPDLVLQLLRLLPQLVHFRHVCTVVFLSIEKLKLVSEKIKYNKSNWISKPQKFDTISIVSDTLSLSCDSRMYFSFGCRKGYIDCTNVKMTYGNLVDIQSLNMDCCAMEECKAWHDMIRQWHGMAMAWHDNDRQYLTIINRFIPWIDLLFAQ